MAMRNGTGGSDTIDGTGLDDMINGFGGNDYLIGGGGPDTLIGGAGNDTLVGGEGSDTLRGGAGHDDLYAEEGDRIEEAEGGGIDTVHTHAGSMVLPDHVENLAFLGPDGPAFAFGLGNALDNVISSGKAAATLDGKAGADTLLGGWGEEKLLGGDGNDSLSGGGGADLLDGQQGADVMAGGGGDDTYRVDDPGDLTLESAGAGTDMVLASLAGFALGGNLEHLEYDPLPGREAARFAGTGNALANGITGGAGYDDLQGLAGNDTLMGRGGIDKLAGGEGDDLLHGGEADGGTSLDGGNILDGEAGNDTAEGSAGDDTARGGEGDDRLVGHGGADFLLGHAGRDTLVGGSGADSLAGGAQRDVLDGGGGADRFLFGSVEDSRPWRPGAVDTRDLIERFDRGVDRIDLSLIDARPATQGDDAFIPAAGPAAHAIWQVVSGGGVILSADVTGDAVADFALVIRTLGGGTALGAGDIVL